MFKSVSRNYRLGIKYYFAVILFTLVLSITLFVLMPNTRETLFHENQIVENLTWGFYLLVFFWGSYRYYKLNNKQLRKAYILLPIMGLIGFVDETSMGAQLFWYELPYYAHYNLRLEGFKTIFQLVKMHIYFNDLSKDFVQLLLLKNTPWLATWVQCLSKHSTQRGKIP